MRVESLFPECNIFHTEKFLRNSYLFIIYGCFLSFQKLYYRQSPRCVESQDIHDIEREVNASLYADTRLVLIEVLSLSLAVFSLTARYN